MPSAMSSAISRVALPGFQVPLVHLPNEVQLPSLLGEVERAVLDVLDQLFDLLVLRVDVRALVRAGQKRRPPVLRGDDWKAV